MAITDIQLHNGNKMPNIGFGTWQIRFNGRARKAVAQALNIGYRLIDTARIYGNEKGVGQAIRESGIAREEIFVTTKLWNSDQGYEKAHAAFAASLERLGLDYVDLYLIHWPVSGKRRDSWRALEEIYASGRARAIGVSNFTLAHLKDLQKVSEVMPAVNQIELHPFVYETQREVVDFCHDQNIVVEAYSPLAHAIRLHDPTISDIAQKHQKSNAQTLLRWSIQQGAVPVPKSSHPDRMKENLDIFEFELSPADMGRLNNLSDGSRTCWDPTFIT